MFRLDQYIFPAVVAANISDTVIADLVRLSTKLHAMVTDLVLIHD